MTPPMLAPHALGPSYVDTISPYMSERTADGGITWMRHAGSESRQWLHRVTVTTDPVTGKVLTSVEKTFGQWVGREHHAWVPVNDEYETSYFDDINVDAVLVSGLVGGAAVYNGSYVYTGRRFELTMVEDTYTFVEDTTCKPVLFCANADLAEPGFIVFNNTTQQWNLVLNIDPDDELTWGTGIVPTAYYHRDYADYLLERIAGTVAAQIGIYTPDYAVQKSVTVGGAFIDDGLHPIFLHPRYNDAVSPYKAFIIYDASIVGGEKWTLYTGAYDGEGANAPVAVVATLVDPSMLGQLIPPQAVWDLCTVTEYDVI